MSLYDRAATNVTEALNLSAAPDKVKHGLVAAVLAVASSHAGKKLSILFPTFNAKGFEATFKEGGAIKIRPKSGGVVVAKLYGYPTLHGRMIGVGKSIPEALKNLAPESPLPSAAGPINPPDASEPVDDAGAKAEKKAAKEAAKAAKALAKAAKAAKPPEPPKKPGPEMETVGGIHLHNTAEVDQETFDRYARALADSAEILKKRGFGFLIGKFPMKLVAGKGPLGNYTGAQYAVVQPEVQIFVDQIGRNADPAEIMTTMIHEIGHHYYYKDIPYSLRKTYAWYFKKAKTSGGQFASSYGATERYEDFAEIFAAFIGKGTKLQSSRYKLTPDIMQRFRSFLGQDKRIDLKAEEKDVPPGRSLYDRISEGKVSEMDSASDIDGLSDSSSDEVTVGRGTDEEIETNNDYLNWASGNGDRGNDEGEDA